VLISITFWLPFLIIVGYHFSSLLVAASSCSWLAVPLQLVGYTVAVGWLYHCSWLAIPLQLIGYTVAVDWYFTFQSVLPFMQKIVD
jgi:hypothetical protein